MVLNGQERIISNRFKIFFLFFNTLTLHMWHNGHRKGPNRKKKKKKKKKKKNPTHRLKAPPRSPPGMARN